MASVIEKTIRSAVTPVITAVANYNRKRLPEPNGGHPFLGGLHEPMQSEETISAMQVTGTIPDQLDGRYLRIGPNPLKKPHSPSHHWFVGDGMAHGIRIRGGEAVWYRNRWIRSNAVSDALGEPRAPGTRNPRSDTANTNIVGIDGRTFAIVEAGGFPVELNDELDTIRHNPFDGTLTHAFSAHPHLDPKTGERHAICYEATTQDTVWHVVVNAAGKVTREEPIAVKDGPSIHDCAITENFVLVLDLPATLSMKRLIKGFQFPYDWNPAHGARVGLLPKTGSNDDIIWCDVDPCYVFHPANAFETADGKVIVDVVAHESMYAQSPYGPGGKWARFERWTIDPETRSVDRKIIHDRNQEFPRHDERRTTQPYRYVYSVALADNDSGVFDRGGSQLFKHDLERGETLTRELGDDRYPGEFVFVPRSDEPGLDAREDDGWLIGLVIDAANETTELQILNADDFLGEPQAVIHVPHRIPPGFHGNWVAS